MPAEFPAGQRIAAGIERQIMEPACTSEHSPAENSPSQERLQWMFRQGTQERTGKTGYLAIPDHSSVSAGFSLPSPNLLQHLLQNLLDRQHGRLDNNRISSGLHGRQFPLFVSLITLFNLLPDLFK